MGLGWMLALQIVGAPAPEAPPMLRVDFDLAKVEPFDLAEFKLLPECAATEGDAILVCARGVGEAARYGAGPPLADRPMAMDELGDALSFSLGPLRIGSLKQADGRRAFGIGMKF